ncbi:MAG: PAS domain S-box protein, partial [Smithellaceae bacterium]
IRRMKGEEVPLVYSFRVISQDGTVKWVEFNTAVIQWKGRPATLSFLNDITERKRTEDALRESESKYRFMTDNVADIIWTVDMNLDFTYISPSVQRFRGFTVEEAMSQKIHEVLTPASLQYALKVLEEENKILMGNPDHIKDKLTIELEEYCKDGSTIWTENELKYLPDQDGKPIGIIGVTRDISARKQAAETLRESEEYFKEITENSSDVIIITDKNGDIKYCSRSIERFSGYKPEELIGKSGFTFIHPDDLERAVDDYGKAILIPGSAIPNEFRVVRKDGATRYFDGLGKNLLDNPAVAGFVMNIRDITERKQAEEEKRRLEERLQHAHKMEAIGTLAGGIAHDFNNLLMGIQGYTSLTLLTLDPDNPNRERLKQIQEQVQSGAELAKQLLGFARGGRYEVKPADISNVIQKTSSMFGRTKKEITIHTKYEKNLSPVEVDLGQMEQVFMNLYVNAWQAMPGGGNIYLETENIFLNDELALLYSVKPGKYVKITVTDTGTGMDEKTRKRIFDPFFTTKEMGRGTGLGLATVYGIINGHKGMINVYSEPGHGTTFTIYLPASEKEIVKEETATGTIDRGTETILLVDDEKIILEVSRELLESMGYRVYAVGSGQEAVALFTRKRHEIDLVILDMIMPEISGGETFDRLREINPGIKVLLSSGYSLNGEAQTIMDRGCKGFIQKPFLIENLSRKVREILD